MSAILDLKESLEQALKEHSELVGNNKRLESDIHAARIKLKELDDEIRVLEHERDGLESDIKSNRSAMLAAIDQRNAESEKMKNYVLEEKKAVNLLKSRLEDESMALEKEKASVAASKNGLNEKIRKIDELLKELKS